VRKLANSAFLTLIPAESNTAKSPKVSTEIYNSIKELFKPINCIFYYIV
jgi:hypothetical protein